VDATVRKAASLEWEQARETVIREVQRTRPRLLSEPVAITEAYLRVLGSDVTADRDYPTVARSLRDGFAIHAAESPGTFRITGESRAGEGAAGSLQAGCALEIMTGAPVPQGADAIVMIENVERTNGNVTVARAAAPGQFINTAGAEARQGAVLIASGTRLDASHVCTLAMTGHTQASVFRRPSVAILSTGDELVDVGVTPAPHQIRNSNSYSLAALVSGSGANPTILPVAPDTESGLLRLLEQGLEHDLLLISGGVSAGKYDLVKPCLRRLGAEFFFERVKIQPGQPTAFGCAKGKFVFGLPGNPGSSMVTYQLFARAALEILGGISHPRLEIFHAVFEEPFRHKPGLTRFLPASIRENGLLKHVPWQGSSDIPALAKANVFLIADAERESWSAGDSIRVMLKL
jgi:molybdopterin molybdotransferase